MKRPKGRPTKGIEYSIYPANYNPVVDIFYVKKTMREALKKALKLGDGAEIVKRHEEYNRDGFGSIYATKHYEIFIGKRMRIVYDITERAIKHGMNIHGKKKFFRSGARKFKRPFP